jgi:allantoinase
MNLPDDYLDYPKRRYGMDQDLYAWRTADQRAKVTWPEGKSVAAMIVVPIEHHMLDPAGKPFKHPGAMVTPYPDLRHFTTRDYGNRVGVFRILKALKAAGAKATFPVNAVLLAPLRPLVEAILEDGHEIAAYGLDTDHIHWGGLDRETEAAWIDQTKALFAKTGLTPRAWMSPARQQSFNTLELLAKAGFGTCLDWEQDTIPVRMTTPSGAIVGAPLSNELDDRLLLADRKQDEATWSRQILEAVAYTKAEAPRFGGQVVGFTLTPYVAGQPFRAAVVAQTLKALGEDASVWTATASEIVDAWASQSA